MPWEIVPDDNACPVSRPWGVHKQDGGDLEGCHPTQADALEQMAALHASESDQETNSMEQHNEERAADESIYPLTPRQIAQYDALESVAELFGRWDKSSGPDGAHYVEVSPFPGLMCSSCAFYEGPRACEVVEGDIDPEGVCKMWIIPGDLVPADQTTVDQPDDQPAARVSALTGAEYRKDGEGWAVPEIERRALSDVEIRMDGDRPVIEGYATVYNYPYDVAGGPDAGGFQEIIARGAATKSVAESGNRDDVRLLIDHAGTPLARTRSGTLELSSDDIGLRVRAELDPANPKVAELRSAMERGDVDQMSFAFRAIRQSWSDDYTTRTISEVRLYDVSVVTFPANPATVVKMRSSDVISVGDHKNGRSVEMARRQAEHIKTRD